MSRIRSLPLASVILLGLGACPSNQQSGVDSPKYEAAKKLYDKTLLETGDYSLGHPAFQGVEKAFLAVPPSEVSYPVAMTYVADIRKGQKKARVQEKRRAAEERQRRWAEIQEAKKDPAEPPVNRRRIVSSGASKDKEKKKTSENEPLGPVYNKGLRKEVQRRVGPQHIQRPLEPIITIF